MPAIIFDTELNKLDGEIISSAFLQVSIDLNGVLHTTDKVQPEVYYKPSEPIQYGAMAVHHILDEDLADCIPSSSFRLPRIHGSDVEYIIGHQVDSDIKAVERTGQIVVAKRICTLAMARYLWPEADSHNLAALTYLVAKDKAKARQLLRHAHSAMADCQATAILLQAIIQQQPGITNIEDLYQFSEECRIPKFMYRGSQKGKPISDLTNKELQHWLHEAHGDKYLFIALKKEYNYRHHWSKPKLDDGKTVTGLLVRGLRLSATPGKLWGTICTPIPTGMDTKKATWYFDGRPEDEKNPALNIQSIYGGLKAAMEIGNHTDNL